MNDPVANQPGPRRSVWRWILLGAALLFTPVLIVGLGVLSVLTLDRNAATLRHELMAATGSDWHTKVQLNAGWTTLTAARGVLHFVRHEHMDEARLALASVRHASVGVYERRAESALASLADVLRETDTIMQGRGLVRMLCVQEGRQTVLGYTSAQPGWGNRVDFCLAVLDGKELVVVSTKIDADALSTLVDQCADRHDLRRKLKLSKLKI